MITCLFTPSAAYGRQLCSKIPDILEKFLKMSISNKY